MRNAKLCPVRSCDAVIFVDRLCCKHHWALASAKLRGRYGRARAAWRDAMAGGDADARGDAVDTLQAVSDATLGYIHAMLEGGSPHHAGRIAKRMAAEEQQL